MSNAGQTTANQILSAASQLTAAQFETYQRLCKRLLHGPQFQLIVLDCRDERLQQQLQQLLTELCQQADLPASELVLDESIPDVFALQEQLQALTSQFGVIQLTGAAFWFSQPKRWDSFNLLRENIASRSPGRLLLWLNAEAIAAMIEQAPDWWAWRSGVYEFGSEYNKVIDKPELQPDSLFQSNQHKDQAARRIATLNDWLHSPAATDPELSAPLWYELAGLYRQLGDWEQSLNLYQTECLPRFKSLGNTVKLAATYGMIAHILMLKGQYDQALQTIEKQELPAYQSLGRNRGIATAQGRIGDILYRLGKYHDALNIWQQQVIPILETIGDSQAIALYKGRIGDVYIDLGEYEKALQNLREAAVALHQQNDIRGTAICKSRIARVLFYRGEFADALNLLRQEALPVYQKLGDVQGVALTQAFEAKILAAQGHLTEALTLLRQDALPKLNQLGDLRGVCGIQIKIADILFASGDSEQALHLYQTEILPALIQLKNKPITEQARQQINAIKQSLAQAAALPQQN